MKNGETVKRYPATVFDQGAKVKIVLRSKPEKLVKIFKTARGKPAVRMALESVIRHYTSYDPQVHSVTIVARE